MSDHSPADSRTRHQLKLLLIRQVNVEHEKLTSPSLSQLSNESEQNLRTTARDHATITSFFDLFPPNTTRRSFISDDKLPLPSMLIIIQLTKNNTIIRLP